MKFTPQKPVAWFSPSVLANAATKVVLSSIFGSYSDKREGFRTENAAFFDYSAGAENLHVESIAKTTLSLAESVDFMRNVADSQIDASRAIKGEFGERDTSDMWIDFVSDLGDGFNATYTMAHLLAQPELTAYNQKLPRGKVLIMGGDEVYPTADIIEYKNRMLGPYNAAFPFQVEDKNRPHLYAVPGNHDWYDGLTNFVKIFCQKRFIGNWETYQQYSYFAIKLPHNVWIWAIDVQLVSEMDLGQMEYFRRVIKHAELKGDSFAGSNVILCTAEPAWVFRATQAENFSYEKLKTFEEKVIRAYGGKLAAVLTGDLHHYSHYECTDKDVEPPVFHRITAGGGGAFLHPTHGLPENYDIKYLEKKDTKAADGTSQREVRERHEQAELKATFPIKEDSRRLIWKNLRFTLFNKGLSAILGAVFLLMGVFMNTAGINSIADMFGNAAEKIAFPVAAWLIGIILVLGMGQFTDVLRNKYYKIAGYIHGIGHVLLFALAYHGLKMLPFWEGTCCPNFLFLASLMAVMFVISGTWFGIYLIITNLALDIHENEGFSSFMHEGYKNFLRIRITADELTIYPIGVKQEVRDWRVNYDATQDKMNVSGSEPILEMLEKEPIIIKLT